MGFILLLDAESVSPWTPACLSASGSAGGRSALLQFRRVPRGLQRIRPEFYDWDLPAGALGHCARPTAGQKLESDPRGQMGGGQGQPFPVTGLQPAQVW